MGRTAAGTRQGLRGLRRYGRFLHVSAIVVGLYGGSAGGGE